MKNLLLLLCLGVLAFGQASLVIYPISDITGTGAAVPLSTSGTARSCQLVALSTNTAGIRWGDSTVTASRGANIAPGAGQFIPPNPPPPGQASPSFNLNTVYVYIGSSDVLTVTCMR